MNLYILESTDGKSIKIGKANDVEKRLNGLPYSFDKNKSYYFEIGTRVFSVESGLHSMLMNYRVELPKADGYTEFFKIEAKDKVIDFLEFSGFEKLELSAFSFPEIDKSEEASRKIGQMVKSFRVNEMDLTQSKCSEFLEIPLSTYKRLENEGSGSLSNFLRFLEASGKLDDLLYIITPKENSRKRATNS